MRISAKSRYALAAVVEMAQNASGNRFTTVISISQKLGISKIYLEQVFSLLKKDGIVRSVKGSQGGYHLIRSPEEITVKDVLLSTEPSLMEPAKETVAEQAPVLDDVLKEQVFQVLDEALRSAMQQITVAQLVEELQARSGTQNYMYYI